MQRIQRPGADVQKFLLQLISRYPIVSTDPNWYKPLESPSDPAEVSVCDIHIRLPMKWIYDNIARPDANPGYYAIDYLERIKKAAQRIKCSLEKLPDNKMSEEYIMKNHVKELAEIRTISARLYNHIAFHTPEIFATPITGKK